MRAFGVPAVRAARDITATRFRGFERIVHKFLLTIGAVPLIRIAHKCIDAEQHRLTLQKTGGPAPSLRDAPGLLLRRLERQPQSCQACRMGIASGRRSMPQARRAAHAPDIKEGAKCSDAESLHRTLSGTS